MCPPIVGLIIGIAGSFMQAAMTAQIAQQQAIIQQQQLRVEIENERIAQLGRTNDRLEELRRAEASNRALISTTGVDVNYAYEQAIVPYNKLVAGRDVTRDMFNTEQEVGRKRYEIAVAGWKAKATRASAFVEAGASAFGQVGRYVMA